MPAFASPIWENTSSARVAVRAILTSRNLLCRYSATSRALRSLSSASSSSPALGGLDNPNTTTGIDDVRAMMSGMLQPEIKETIVGVAQVRDVFRSSKFGVVAGCLVAEGFVRRNNPIRVLRDNVVIFEGALESLRRFKDDVNEVRAGTECGIGVKNYQDVRAGDQIECFSRVEVARTLQ